MTVPWEGDMPIKAENRARYPKDWRAISTRIRFVRAEGQCECEGECGQSHDGRCAHWHNERMATGSKCVLTVAHLNHRPEDCRDDNLRAMCQGCHLRYDHKMHIANGRATRRKCKADGDLFENAAGAELDGRVHRETPG